MKETVLYTQEIMPRVRKLAELQEEAKSYVDSIEEVANLRQDIKNAQEKLANFLKKDEDYQTLLTEIKAENDELKQALKSAKKVFGQKPATLKAYFKHRAKEDGVKKVVEKGVVFQNLSQQIDGE